MQRRLCVMSEAKWSIAEAKCLQMSHNKYASQRDAISPLYDNLMLSHSAGMHNTDKSIAGISKRFHFASLHYIFSAYLPTHIKFLTEFHRIFFGTTCISLPLFFIHPLYPITRRPVDFSQIGVNRVLMDLIGCKISHKLPKKCDFCYDVEYLRKSWA